MADNKTLDEIVQVAQVLDAGLDAILPLTPAASLAPLFDLLTRSLEKLQQAVEDKGKTPAEEVVGVETAHAVAEDLKFPVGKP